MRFVRPGEPPPPELLPFRERLLARRVREFDEHNWWEWGRYHRESEAPRVYVNGRTRAPRPFFVHPCRDWDGSVLAIFPHDLTLDPAELAAALNDEVPWVELGFVCDGRFLFSQRSLERAPLPASFARFLPGRCADEAQPVQSRTNLPQGCPS
jgi:adenine-specific DNA-methyltransferase